MSSWAPYVDEICLLYTGRFDFGLARQAVMAELAEEEWEGHLVMEPREWVDDFAELRNEAMGLSAAPLRIVLDGDEVLEGSPAAWDVFLSAVEACRVPGKSPSIAFEFRDRRPDAPREFYRRGWWWSEGWRWIYTADSKVTGPSDDVVTIPPQVAHIVHKHSTMRTSSIRRKLRMVRLCSNCSPAARSMTASRR